MSSNPAFRRGAIQAFHHEINYAFRKLRGNAPAAAIALAPHKRQLHQALVEVSPHMLLKPSANWPPWKSRSGESSRATDDATSAGSRASMQVAIVDHCRMLKECFAEETVLPQDGDLRSCSDTESWPSCDDVSRKRHSRKPRCGRRAKARQRQDDMEMAMRSAEAESSFEHIAGGSGGWGATLGAIVEALGEDLEDSRRFLPGNLSGDAGAMSSEGSVEDHEDVDDERPLCSKDEEKLSCDLGSNFAVELHKRTGGALGMALVEQDGVIIVNGVYEGPLQQWNEVCSKQAAVRVGDVLSTANGFSDISAIMSQCQRPGPIVLGMIRGPIAIRDLCSAGDVYESSLGLSNSPQRVKNHEFQSHSAEQRQELQQQLRQAQETDNKKRFNECEGQGDLQRLIVSRLAASMMNRS